MLGYLRENTGNWIIKFFLGIIVIVFVFLGVGSLGSKRNDSVASIDDEPISIKEFQQSYNKVVAGQSYQQVLSQLKAQYGNQLNDTILKALRVEANQQAITALINEKIVLQHADKLGITISDKELQNNLLSIKAFQVDGKFNFTQYQRLLNLEGMTTEIFEQDQINLLRQLKVREMVLSAVNVSDLEAKNWYLFQNKKIAVDYLKFDPRTYTDIHPDDNAVQAYFDENKAKYKSEPKVKAIYLRFDPADHKAKVSITDENIKVFYQENGKLFETPEKVEARHILFLVDATASEDKNVEAFKKAKDVYEKALKGEDFALLAKTYSEGPTKKTGGYLGIFEQKSMVKPFGDKAFSMKAGEISEPVKTQFGWHVINVVSRIDASKQSFDQVKNQIKRELEQQEMQNLAYAQADKAFEAVIDGDDIEQISRIVKIKPVETKAFSIKGEDLAVADNLGFAKAAFALKTGDISDVKQLGDAYYLIKVVEKIETKEQALAMVKEQVTWDLTIKLQNETARKDAQAIIEKINSVKTLGAIAQLNKLTVKTTKLFSRSDTIEGVGRSREFIQAGFGLNQSKPIHPEIIETAEGYFVIGFNKQQLPEESEIMKDLEATKQEIIWKKQVQSYQAWLAALRKQHDIIYDPKFINL
ncbi:MAG: SurA N-terminal domain-containing protein [Pseudomonadota bacterium]